MTKIALGMIVKNEAHCIERCLDSVKPLIDFVCIEDTESTDNTVEKIIEWCRRNKLNYEISKYPWASFDVNRSRVLWNLYTNYIKFYDYVLMIDADEVLVLEAGFNIEEWKKSLVHDIYDIETKLGGVSYLRPQLTSNKKKFSYRGVVHEFLQPLEETVGRGTVKGLFNMPIQDSARNKDPDKYKKDAEVLEKIYVKETDPFLKSRYCFYLAQSLKDLGDTSTASIYYAQRAQMEFWPEERYISLLSIGRMGRIKGSEEFILRHFIKAIDFSPNRVETLYEAMITLRDMGKMNAAYVMGKAAFDKCYDIVEDLEELGGRGDYDIQELKKPEGCLFLEPWVYDWAVAYELSIIAFYANNKELARRLTLYTIDNTKAPVQYREQSKKNLEFYK